jgi:hypothetical protein
MGASVFTMGDSYSELPFTFKPLGEMGEMGGCFFYIEIIYRRPATGMLYPIYESL